MARSFHLKSTTVRAYRRMLRTALRGVFRTLDPIAPGVAARWATRIWATPPRPTGADRMLPSAAGRDHGLTRPGDQFLTALAVAPQWARRPVRRLPRGRQLAVPATASMVVAEVWGDGPVTYLLHGWGGRRTQFAALVEPLVAAGQRVVALDAPGHGQSGPGRLGGRRTTLAEFAEALAAVVAVTGPAHAVVAHSAGSNAAALAVRDGLAVDRLVFVAPLANPLPYLHAFARLIGLGHRTRPRLLRRLTRIVGRDLADFDVPARAAQAEPGRRLPRLLMVHDRADREARYAEGRALAAAWPNARLLTTEGLGHRRILADPEVVEATVAFLTDHAEADHAGTDHTGTDHTGTGHAGTGHAEADRREVTPARAAGSTARS